MRPYAEERIEQLERQLADSFSRGFVELEIGRERRKNLKSWFWGYLHGFIGGGSFAVLVVIWYIGGVP